MCVLWGECVDLLESGIKTTRKFIIFFGFYEVFGFYEEKIATVKVEK